MNFLELPQGRFLIAEKTIILIHFHWGHSSLGAYKFMFLMIFLKVKPLRKKKKVRFLHVIFARENLLMPDLLYICFLGLLY